MKVYLVLFLFAFAVSTTFAKVGENCTEDKSCLGGNGEQDKRQECDGTAKKCKCKEDYKETDDKLCRKPFVDDFSCDLDLDCQIIYTSGTGDAKCNDYCRCPQENWELRGNEVKGFECYAVGVACTDDDQCADRLTCNKVGRCECEEGYELSYDTLQCRKDFDIISYSCEKNVDCEYIETATDFPTTCKDNKCTCPHDNWRVWSYTWDMGYCVSLMTECKEDSDCHDDREKCNNGWCACKEGYETSSNFEYCIKPLDDTFSCGHDVDCAVINTGGTGEASCKQGKCKCPLDNCDLRKDGDAFDCYAVGVECTDDDSCADRLACSKDKKCECKENFETTKDERLCRRPLNSSYICENDVDCGIIDTGDKEPATCEAHMCNCPGNGLRVRGSEEEGFVCDSGSTTLVSVILLAVSYVISKAA